jgi:predicted ABC-type ATPase
VSRLDLIVGPNGAGKTTLYERVIAPDRPGLPFVNADRIASDRFPGQELEQAHAAAEIAARARDAMIAARLDLCTETVFSHESKVDLVISAAAAGYDVVLHVVMIPLKLSGPRVAVRVASGGHDVPADKLASRYTRLWPYVATVVPHCHRAVFYDNATDDGPSEVASYRYGIADYPPRWPPWAPEPLLAL